MQGSTYSFLDFRAAYSGPNGTEINLSQGGVADEGITIAFTEDKGTLVTGAGGDWMHSLHAAQPGTVTVRLLKTSSLNGRLSALFNLETVSSANYGKGTITCRNPVSGDSFFAQGAALRKVPDNVNSKEGGTNEWVFNCGHIDQFMGDGDPIII